MEMCEGDEYESSQRMWSDPVGKQWDANVNDTVWYFWDSQESEIRKKQFWKNRHRESTKNKYVDKVCAALFGGMTAGGKPTQVDGHPHSARAQMEVLELCRRTGNHFSMKVRQNPIVLRVIRACVYANYYLSLVGESRDVTGQQRFMQAIELDARKRCDVCAGERATKFDGRHKENWAVVICLTCGFNLCPKCANDNGHPCLKVSQPVDPSNDDEGRESVLDDLMIIGLDGSITCEDIGHEMSKIATARAVLLVEPNEAILRTLGGTGGDPAGSSVTSMVIAGVRFDLMSTDLSKIQFDEELLKLVHNVPETCRTMQRFAVIWLLKPDNVKSAALMLETCCAQDFQSSRNNSSGEANLFGGAKVKLLNGDGTKLLTVVRSIVNQGYVSAEIEDDENGAGRTGRSSGPWGRVSMINVGSPNVVVNVRSQTSMEYAHGRIVWGYYSHGLTMAPNWGDDTVGTWECITGHGMSRPRRNDGDYSVGNSFNYTYDRVNDSITLVYLVRGVECNLRLDVRFVHPGIGAMQWRDVQPSSGEQWASLRNISYIGMDDKPGQLRLPRWTRWEETKFRECLFNQAAQTVNEHARELQYPLMEEAVIGTTTPIAEIPGSPKRSSSEEPVAVPADRNIPVTTTTSTQGSASNDNSIDEENVSEVVTEHRDNQTDSAKSDKPDWDDDDRSATEPRSDVSGILFDDI
jgi:hypothetical protein